jgi:crotonobetainyl-CoA:carnitine CoA-transferase CaiB-like acyl-CoA transferase
MDLSAVRVLDLTQLLPGPYATQLLRDMDAEVVKVERPDGGDPGRSFGAPDPEADEPATGPDGEPVEYESSPLFDVVNRGKRSVTLDLSADAGRETFLDIAAEADVVVEQLRPGVVDRLGIGDEDVRAVSPEVVYCSLSAYGQTGPGSERVGHDLNCAGAAGLLDMTRPEPGTAPVLPGFPVADMAGGLFAALSVVSALLSRELGTGDGEYLDVSMTDAVLSLSQIVAGPAMAGQEQRPGETVLTGVYPCYGVYECADGRYVTLATLEERFWETFCQTIDRPDLADDHMADDAETRERVRRELADRFRQRPRAAWLEDLAGVDAMVGPVSTVSEAFEDSHLRTRAVVQAVDGLLRRAVFPVQSSDDPPRTTAPPPALGEHTESVLREVGYASEEITALREAGVVSTGGE